MVTFIRFPVHSRQNSGWLKVKRGEILHVTGGRPKKQRFNWHEGEPWDSYVTISILISLFGWAFEGTYENPAYRAVNSEGNVGCECRPRFSLTHSDFCLILSPAAVVSACTCPCPILLAIIHVNFIR
jgi:hypothetical protein